jgi:hypothetical protein
MLGVPTPPQSAWRAAIFTMLATNPLGVTSAYLQHVQDINWPVAGPPADAPTCTLIDADDKPFGSDAPGTLGGHRRRRLYGRLDCPSALRAIARRHYVVHRVFFADEPTAIAVGYRPCAVCLSEAYARWKANRGTTP